MNIFVINLASQPQRWQRMERQFGALGARVLRLEAVPGRDLPEARRAELYCEELNRRQYHRGLQPGEIGCYASHIAAWQQLMRSGEGCAAVFEDDVALTPELPGLLAAIERLPRHWDIIKLVGRSREKVRERLPVLPGRSLIGYRRVPSLTGAYVVSREGAQKLLARHPPFGRPVDVDMRYWWECGLRILGTEPYPVHQAPGSGSVMENRGGRRTLVKRLHKLRLQLGYSWLNWKSTHLRAAGRGTEAAQEAEPALRDAARARPDAG